MELQKWVNESLTTYNAKLQAEQNKLFEAIHILAADCRAEDQRMSRIQAETLNRIGALEVSMAKTAQALDAVLKEVKMQRESLLLVFLFLKLKPFQT